VRPGPVSRPFLRPQRPFRHVHPLPRRPRRRRSHDVPRVGPDGRRADPRARRPDALDEADRRRGLCARGRRRPTGDPLPPPARRRGPVPRPRRPLPAGGRARPLRGGGPDHLRVGRRGLERRGPRGSRDLRAARGRLQRGRHLRRCPGAPLVPRGPRRDGPRADARARRSRRAELGLRPGGLLRAGPRLRPPRRPAPPRRRRPPGRPGGAPGRRLQPLRPRRRLRQRLCPLPERLARDAVGPGHEPRRRGGRGRAPLPSRQRPALAARVPRRRPAPRRHFSSSPTTTTRSARP
jgi:hypothetical protein